MKEASTIVLEQKPTTQDDIAAIVRSFERDLEESDRALEETIRFAETLLLPAAQIPEETKISSALVPHHHHHLAGTTTNETATTTTDDDDDDDCEDSFDDSDDLRSDSMSSLTHDDDVVPRRSDDHRDVNDDEYQCSSGQVSRCYTEVGEEEEEVPLLLATIPTSLAVDISRFCDCPTIKLVPDHANARDSNGVAAQVPVSSLIKAVQALLGERQQVIGEALEIIQSSRRTVALTTTMAEMVDEANFYSSSCVLGDARRRKTHLMEEEVA